jgi:hypothetical protein
MDFDWKKLLGAVAPALGTALGGPFGALAGTVLNAALGLGDTADEAARVEALKKATPEQLLALQNAERQFTLDLQKLGVDLAKIDAEDRNSARTREASVKDQVPGTLAVVVTLCFFGLLGWLMLREPPAGSRDILNLMLGALGAAWASIIAYYFGSSAGSQAKNRLLLAATTGDK